MNLIQPIVLCFWAFAAIFLYCECSENISSRFDKIHTAICACDWYLFPVKIQKTLPTILITTEERVVIIGFGNIPFNRKTFKMVKYCLFY